MRLGPVVGNRRDFLRFEPSSPIVRPVVLPVEDLLPTDSTTNRPTIARLPKGPVPLEPAITRDQFSRATRAGRGQS